MQFEELFDKAKEVKSAYDATGQKRWALTEYAQGLVGDVGDLVKLIMAKNNFRDIENVDEKIKHELSDCLWAVMMVADELNIDLEKEFLTNIDGLKNRINLEKNRLL
jgi:NTP pyrophosphatase (non-canonical NTP hydrolase)